MTIVCKVYPKLMQSVTYKKDITDHPTLLNVKINRRKVNPSKQHN